MNVIDTLGTVYNRLIEYRLASILGLCILLGGSSSYALGLKYVLYGVSVIAIASCLTSPMRHWRVLINIPFVVGVIFVTLFFIYIIPLPFSYTVQLPFRDLALRGYDLAGLDRPRLPLSLTPQTTYISLYDFLPPFAIGIILLLSTRNQEIRHAITVLMVMIAASALWGVLQFLWSSPDIYFQKTYMAGTGTPVGFFANPNHFASLLVIGILLSAYQIFQAINSRRNRRRKYTPVLTAFIVMSILLISLTRSNSAVVILGMTFIPLLFLMVKSRQKKRFFLGLSFLCGLLFLFDYLIIGNNLQNVQNQLSSIEGGRIEIWSTIINHPSYLSVFGTGPGSFYETYLIMSQSSDFNRVYINEAHNDYLQIVMELGLIGGGLVIGFLIWFAKSLVVTILHKTPAREEKLLCLFCMLVPLLHSITDYPLRTPAFMGVAVFFTCLYVRLSQMENVRVED